MPANDAAVRSWIEACLGVGVGDVHALAGGAGARRYARVQLEERGSAIWMHALSEDAAILPPALRVQTQELPFITVTHLLAEQGLPVPEIYAVDAERSWVLLEDLGDAHLCDLEASKRRACHRQAIALLARVHAIPRGTGIPFSRCFDEEWILFELRHVLEFGLGGEVGEWLSRGFRALAAYIATLPQTLCLRDFQSQNLMIDGRGALRILDYQDALMAPRELDLAALLFDSYVELADPERSELLGQYAELSGAELDEAALAALTVQRKLKDFARFRYLSKVKDDPRFEPYTGSARSAVLGALGRLPGELGDLARTLGPLLAEPDA